MLSIRALIRRNLSFFVLVTALPIAVANAQTNVDDFMSEDRYVIESASIDRAEKVQLPDILELKTDQEESTLQMRMMMESIVADLENGDDLAYKKPVMKSLFYNLMEYSLIQEARRGFEARGPSQVKQQGPTTERAIKARRNLNLGGIIFRSNKDWSIYLNEVRITPDTLPEEVLDIQVRNDFIRLKWFDKGTNTIFPVKLRANESFNLDARLFFPG